MLPDASWRVDTFHHDGSCLCFVCGDSYETETDAFGDGCMTYLPAMMAAKMQEGDES